MKEEEQITARFVLNYQSPSKAEAVFSSLLVDNQEFNSQAGEELVKTEVDGGRLILTVKGKNLPSFRATVDDLFRSLVVAEKSLEGI